jgi:hypothetical protein
LVLWFEGELGLVNWVGVLEVDPVVVGFAPAKVGFGRADDVFVTKHEIQVAFPELIRDVELDPLLDVLIREHLVGGGLGHGAEEVLEMLLVDPYGVPTYRDFLQVGDLASSGNDDGSVSGVGDGDVASLVVVNLGEARSSKRLWEVLDLDGGEVVHIGLGLPMEPAPDDSGLLRLDDYVGEGRYNVLIGLGDEDLLVLGIIGHLQRLHGRNAQNIVLVIRGDAERDVDHLAVTFNWEVVDVRETEEVVSSSEDTRAFMGGQESFPVSKELFEVLLSHGVDLGPRIEQEGYLLIFNTEL